MAEGEKPRKLLLVSGVDTKLESGSVQIVGSFTDGLRNQKFEKG